MEITTILVRFFGILFAVFGFSMIINRKGTAAALTGLIKSQGLLWLTGLITLVLGSVFVALCNGWDSGLGLIVAIVGWLALIKGVFILFFPSAAAALYRRFVTDGMLVFCGVIAFILGLVFLYWGFM
jgi:hypothetical protein